MNENDLQVVSTTDWKRVDAMTDEDIDTSDIPPLDELFFTNAKIRLPKQKETMIRIDPDVLAWFLSLGKEYQTYINAVLRAYMEAHQTQQNLPGHP
jgi:uncharacterized protein (DUF4415 family)